MSFNKANLLTLFRIAAVPFFVAALYMPQTKAMGAILMLSFIAVAVTDLIDGHIARKNNLVTNTGKFLDPLADKLLICSIMIMLVYLDRIPAWAVIIVVGREMAVLGLRAMALEKGVLISADKYGKLKTLSQVVAICPFLLHHQWWWLDPKPFSTVFLYIALFMTVFSGINYFYGYYAVIRGK